MEPKTKVTLFLTDRELVLLRLFAEKRLKAALRRQTKADNAYNAAFALSADLAMVEARY